MPPFKNPTPSYRFDVSREKSALTRHFTHRGVPRAEDGKLLVATWNIANLGAQKRWPSALDLIAHVLKRFDLIAVQEVNDDLSAFVELMRRLGPAYDWMVTDTAGNQERLAYVYRWEKVQPRNLVAELSLRHDEFPVQTVYVRRRNRQKQLEVTVFPDFRFVPFNRTPYICSFQSGKLDFTLVNAHLYFGKKESSSELKDRAAYARRVLEIHALSRWADRRFEKSTTYDRDMIFLGDLNVPAMDDDDPSFQAMKKYGWCPLDYVTRTGGSNLGNDRTYDQMVFAPGTIEDRVSSHGIFDFDKAVFRSRWDRLEAEHGKRKALGKFNALVKHHLSDHRPLWMQLDVG